jgi:hypothetical protein
LQFILLFLVRAFTNQDHHPVLDHFFSLFFARLLSSGLWPSAEQSVFLQDISTRAALPAPAQFEDLLPAAHWIPLPCEAQVRSHILFNLDWHQLAPLYFYVPYELLFHSTHCSEFLDIPGYGFD